MRQSSTRRSHASPGFPNNHASFHDATGRWPGMEDAGCGRGFGFQLFTYRREELFEAARRSRACAYLADADHGPLALQKILLAGSPTVGVRTGAAFARNGVTGFWVDSLPPGGRYVRNDEEMLLLKVYIDLITQAQAIDRTDVRNGVIEQFHSDGIVTQVLNCLSGLRSTGGIASATVV